MGMKAWLPFLYSIDYILTLILSGWWSFKPRDERERERRESLYKRM